MVGSVTSMNGINHQDAVRHAKPGSTSTPPAHASDLDASNNLKMANGVHSSVHGGPVNGLRSLTNGEMDGPVHTLHDLPSEIRHITDNQFPISMLVNRQIQECWNSLSELVNEMADYPMESQPNGAPGRPVQQQGKPWGDQSNANLQKKDKLLTWAQNQRSLFVKLLVLSQWSQNMPEVAKMIDIMAWLREQLLFYERACDDLGYLRRDTAAFQIPNPDLKTAAEVLATGRLSTFPHLGYIKSKPLSPRKALKTLRRINNIVCTRLSLQQEVPSGFASYKIHDGRVTFVVPSEFELDLSLTDEDPKSQFYFVNFRFLFAPRYSIPDGRFLDEISGIVNDKLRANGLHECYDYLHNLTLSYKISILLRQTLEMARGQWSDQLRVELIRRTLVVQYWRNRPSGKSWIEVGIKSGRRKEISRQSNGSGVPFLDIRWIRDGKMMTNEDIWFDDTKLSLERILQSVIAQHTSHLLDSIYDKMSEYPLYAQGDLAIEVSTSITDPGECSLTIQLTKTRSLTLKIEPITGSLILQPTSQGLIREEMALNRSKNVLDDAATRLSYLRCVIADQDLTVIATSAGWEVISPFKPPKGDLRQVFPRSTLKQTFFRLPSWTSSWTLAVTHSMTTDNWWLIDTSNGNLEAEIINTQAIHFASSLSYAYFTALAEHVSSIIAAKVNSRSVRDGSLSLKTPSIVQFAGESHPLEMSLGVPLSSSQGLQIGKITSQKITMRLSGLDPNTGKAQFQVHVQCPMPLAAQQLLINHGASNLRSSFKDGIFVLDYLASACEPILQTLLGDLQRLARLVTFATTLALEADIAIAHISTSHLAIIYHQNPHARLLLEFPLDDSKASAKEPLVLNLNAGNPHERIKHHLRNILINPSRPHASNLSVVLRTLRLTYPLLSILSSIQNISTSIPGTTSTLPRARFHVLTQSPTQYNLHFLPPSPAIEIEITLHYRNNKNMWIFRLTKTASTSVKPGPAGRQSQPQAASSEIASTLEVKRKLREAVFQLSRTDEETNGSQSGDQWTRMEQGAIVDVSNQVAMEKMFRITLDIVSEATPKPSAKADENPEPTTILDKKTPGTNKPTDIKSKRSTNATPAAAGAKKREVITLD